VNAADNSPGISVTSSVNSPAVIATSRASFPLPDFEDMGPIIADDLGLQLLNLAKSLLQQDIEDEHGRHQVFLDELDEVVSAGECGCVQSVHSLGCCCGSDWR
jgi:hypothetical protein